MSHIFLLSNGLPSDTRNTLRKECVSYAEAVAFDEWPQMERSAFSPKAFGACRDLIRTITEFKPQDAQQEGIQNQLLSEICDMSSKRRIRIVNAGHGMSPIMWVVLNCPFSGDLGVKPDSFRLNIILFKHFDDAVVPTKEQLPQKFN